MYDEHEKHEPSLPRELAELERQLASLVPAAPSVERDRLMFEAGAASMRPVRPGDVAETARLGVRFWQSATAVATAASLLLVTRLVWQPPQSAPVVNVAAVESGADSSKRDHGAILLSLDGADRAAKGYLGLRYAVLTQEIHQTDRKISNDHVDLDPPRPATARQILEELLPERNHTST